MLFVIIGVVLIVLNLAGVGVVGTWNWDALRRPLEVLRCRSSSPRCGGSGPTSPGLNKRREMERMEKKKARPPQGKPRRARHGHARRRKAHRQR